MHRNTALSIIIPLTFVFLSVDLARYYLKPIQDLFYKYFRLILRSHETDHKQKRLNGATYVLISATLCIILFPKIIVVTCFSILIICDLTAALVGRQFGKHPFFNKTIEGSLAFFISGIIVIAVTPKIEYKIGEYIIGIFSVAVGTFIEALPLKIDDNLSIPLVVGAILWSSYQLFFPLLDVFKYG